MRTIRTNVTSAKFNVSLDNFIFNTGTGWGGGTQPKFTIHMQNLTYTIYYFNILNYWRCVLIIYDALSPIS